MAQLLHQLEEPGFGLELRRRRFALNARAQGARLGDGRLCGACAKQRQREACDEGGIAVFLQAPHTRRHGEVIAQFRLGDAQVGIALACFGGKAQQVRAICQLLAQRRVFPILRQLEEVAHDEAEVGLRCAPERGELDTRGDELVLGVLLLHLGAGKHDVGAVQFHLRRLGGADATLHLGHRALRQLRGELGEL